MKWWLPLALTGCTLALTTEEESYEEPVTVAQLWDGVHNNGLVVTLDDLMITSPKTWNGRSFFAQTTAGGPQSGIRIELDGNLSGWPPPVGTPVSLRGQIWLFDEGPSLFLSKQDNAEILEEPATPTVTPWTDDPELVYALVQVELGGTTAPDPAGLAQTDLDLQLRRLFDVNTPGIDQHGVATGIALYENGLGLRSPADWSGDFENAPPIDVSVTDLVDLPDGSWVRITNLTQATPWSLDGRYAVLQDSVGNGLWVDTEGWSSAHTLLGDRGDWIGEVRTDGEGLRLRTWLPPTINGQGDVFQVVGTKVGDRIALHLTDLSEPDLQGYRSSAEGWRIDGRFTPIESLPSDVMVVGVIRSSNLLAVTETTAAP
ncbi:MAG: hypothetical protein GWP91_13430 [Rhodobacterales bacterium]|nr:hypothetical protein [Rhodobacterales bacterium]